MKYSAIVFKPVAKEIYETIEIEAESKSDATRKMENRISAQKRIGNAEYTDAKLVRIK